jgi:hypothetical protein
MPPSVQSHERKFRHKYEASKSGGCRICRNARQAKRYANDESYRESHRVIALRSYHKRKGQR